MTLRCVKCVKSGNSQIIFYICCLCGVLLILNTFNMVKAEMHENENSITTTEKAIIAGPQRQPKAMHRRKTTTKSTSTTTSTTTTTTTMRTPNTSTTKIKDMTASIMMTATSTPTTISIETETATIAPVLPVSINSNSNSKSADIAELPQIKYDIIDVDHASNVIDGKTKSGHTTRIITTGEVDDDFWLKHLGEDFKRAIHLQVGGNDHYNQLLNETKNGMHEIVQHEYLPGASIDNMAISNYQGTRMYEKYVQQAAAAAAAAIPTNENRTVIAEQTDTVPLNLPLPLPLPLQLPGSTYNVTLPLPSDEDDENDAGNNDVATTQSDAPYESLFTLDADGVKMSKGYPALTQNWHTTNDITQNHIMTSYVHKPQNQQQQQQQQQQQTQQQQHDKQDTQEQQKQTPPQQQQHTEQNTLSNTQTYTIDKQTPTQTPTQTHTHTQHQHQHSHHPQQQQQQQTHSQSLPTTHQHIYLSAPYTSNPVLSMEEERQLQQELDNAQLTSSMLPYYISKPPQLPPSHHYLQHHTQLPFKSAFNAYSHRQPRHTNSFYYAPNTAYIVYRQPFYRR